MNPLLPLVLASHLSAANVDFSWSVEDGVLIGEATAKTSGWIAVGLNTHPTLTGSVLIMGAALPDGSARIEEHIAQPPIHPQRTKIGGTAGLLHSTVTETNGQTTLRFRLRLVTGDAFVPTLKAGDAAHLTLAWSVSDDFDHHSAERSLVQTTL